MIQTLQLTNTYLGGSCRLFKDTTSGTRYVFQDGCWPYGRGSLSAASSGIQVNVAQTTGPDSDGVYTITMWSDVSILYDLSHLLPMIRNGSKIARVGWAMGTWITSDGSETIVNQAAVPTDITSGDALALDWKIVFP